MIPACPLAQILDFTLYRSKLVFLKTELINSMIRNCFVVNSVKHLIEKTLTHAGEYTRGFAFVPTKLASTFGKLKFKFCVFGAQTKMLKIWPATEA